MIAPSQLTTASLTPEARREAGRARRVQAPRVANGEWQPVSGRRSPIDILEESSRGRVADLVPIRYGRMMASPFAFLRGSAAVMAADLAPTPASGIIVQACGDCHLSNFGLFATPERNLVFDLNDFDETLPAPWEWDIKRLAASFAVVGRENGIKDTRCEAIVRVLADSYRTRLQEFSEMRVLDVWYTRIDDKRLIESAPSATARRYRESITDKARASVAEYLFPKISKVIAGADGVPRRTLVDQPPLVFHTQQAEAVRAIVDGVIASYLTTLPLDRCKLMEQYRFQDLAFKVVGVGSVGTRCWVALYLAGEDDPLLLQVKEARASVLEPYAGRSQFDHHGQRIVVGQRIMQSASDMFLGWTTGTGLDTGTPIHYYVRQLRDMKFSVPVLGLDGNELGRYAAVCGWVLARAHAKGGDAPMISGYLGRSDAFDQALGKFALAYADQTERDHDALVKAVKTGRLQAITNA